VGAHSVDVLNDPALRQTIGSIKGSGHLAVCPLAVVRGAREDVCNRQVVLRVENFVAQDLPDESCGEAVVNFDADAEAG